MTDYDYSHLPIEQLREEAIRLFGKADDTSRHWSRLAALMGHIDENRLYEKFANPNGEPYASVRQWAEDELGLPRSEVFVLRNLHRMMSSADVPPDAWSPVSRVRALIVRKAVNLGGDPRAWIERAITAESTRDLQKELERQGVVEEGWVTWKVRTTEALKEQWETKMVEALPMVLGAGDHDPDLIHDPSIRFRLAEMIFGSFSAREAYVEG